MTGSLLRWEPCASEAECQESGVILPRMPRKPPYVRIVPQRWAQGQATPKGAAIV